MRQLHGHLKKIKTNLIPRSSLLYLGILTKRLPQQ